MANIVPHYVRKVRLPHKMFVCTEMCIFEQMTGIQYYTLTGLGHSEPFARMVIEADGVGKGVMPSGWAPPSDPWALIREYEKGGNVILPVTRNVVTFVTHMDDGRLQLRSFVSPQGDPGLFSLNGGLMESDDIIEELYREAREEICVDVDGEYEKVGDVYDADLGCTNHVFRLSAYDAMLQHQCTVNDAIRALTTVDGIGRAFVWREDLDALIAAGRLTPVSATILGKFPSLLPPPRPASVSKAA